MPKRKQTLKDRDKINYILSRARNVLSMQHIPIQSYAGASSKSDVIRNYLLLKVEKEPIDITISAFELIINKLFDLRCELSKVNSPIAENNLFFEAMYWGLSIVREQAPDKFENLDIATTATDVCDCSNKDIFWEGIIVEKKEFDMVFFATGSHYYKSIINRYLFVSNYLSNGTNTISKALPVDLKVSYELDGKPVSAESLAGKSGKVTIRFDYTNNQYKNVSIDGKNTKIYVPFVMLTGLLLDNDIFTNVEISNGKIINDGDHIIAVGFALPGMQENLNLSRDKIDIPDFVEITADVNNFALSNTLTVAANSIIRDLDVSKLDSADDLQASLTELSSAMSKLLDGSSELYGGLSALLLKSNELISGVDKLANGASALSDGAAALSAGLSELVSNNDTLNAGAKQVFDTLLSTVSQKLKDNGITVDTLTVENYKTVIGGLLENPTDSQKAELINIADAALNAKLSAIGVPQNYYGAVKVLLATKLSSGETQESAMAEIAAMLQNISDPQNAAAIGAAAATAESENGKQIINAFCLNLANQTLEPTVKEAVAQLDSYNEFYKGVLAYTAGAKQAYDGSTKLKNGAKELSDGANALKSGSSQLVGGVQQLTDGSKRLADGLKEFNEKGISKLTSLAGDDLGSLVTRIKATVEVSRDYKSFAGIADGTDGDVKFIYRTDEIK